MIRSTRFRLARLVALPLLLATCGGDRDPVSARPAQIEITPNDPAVHVGQTLRLRARVMSSDGRTLTGRSVSWASLNPEIATIDADGDLHGVGVGVATVRASSSPATATTEITVSPGPHIQLSATQLELTAEGDGAAADEQTIDVTNSGGGRLGSLGVAVTYANAEASDWLAVVLTDTAAPAELVITADPETRAAGTYDATVHVSSPHADNSPAALAVRFVVTEAGPVIGLSDTRASFAATQGETDPAPKTIAVSNAGGATLSGLTTSITYGDRQPTGWLSATIDDDAPGTLTLDASLGALTAGVYTAAVSVSSLLAQNSPQNVTVTFSVGAPVARIALDRDSLTFTATRDGADPTVQAVAITNAGTIPLTELSTSVTYHGEAEGWLARALNTTTAPATLSVGANIDSLDAGTYRATVHVASGVAVNSPQPIEVTLQVDEPPPAIALDSSSVSFAATTETEASARHVVVTNGGGGTLTGLAASITYSAGQPTGWLSATLGSTTAPATLTLATASGPLAAGTYRARVRVSGTDATNSPEIVVTLTVAATAPTAPTIVTSSVVSQSQIQLTWSGATGTVHEYRLERRTAGGTYAEIASLSGSTNTYSDANLASGTAYTYRLRACNAVGCSDYSAETSVTTLPYP